MKKKAIIISIKGAKLSKKERLLFLRENPWGVILFKRNLKKEIQIKKLVSNIRFLTKTKNFPIMIDEEGLNVSRLNNLITHSASSSFFGHLYQKDKVLCINLYKQYLSSLCKKLYRYGININTIPVLDILRNNTSKILNNRIFSKDKKIVKELGKITIDLLKKNKIGSVIKHIPGHGCSKIDSHKKMPIVKHSINKLNKIDFYPFKKSRSQFAMTAHILYEELDKNNVATFSKKIIKNIIRKKIGFKGILISDDISMKALKYDVVTNAKKSLEAGCNLVLYCAGNINENLKLIKSVPYIDKFTQKKTSAFYKFLR
ncbi:MAG: glycoside hydrolase family 3 N-terminal domain-containing protein [Pseudomonadota bacterium]|nr:glycoside hydrolase family 3 N-terminal domain-containing protein [Pseudomonadota bacterium]